MILISTVINLKCEFGGCLEQAVFAAGDAGQAMILAGTNGWTCHGVITCPIHNPTRVSLRRRCDDNPKAPAAGDRQSP